MSHDDLIDAMRFVMASPPWNGEPPVFALVRWRVRSPDTGQANRRRRRRWRKSRRCLGHCWSPHGSYTVHHDLAWRPR
jgi:hypothetical protein